MRLRLAMLRQLDGAAVADLAARLLAECELTTPTRLDLLELVIAARRADIAPFVWACFAKLTAGGRDAVEVLERVERAGGVEAGTTEAWTRFALAASSPEAASTWWTAFVAGWTRALGRPASRRLLEAATTAMRAGALPNDGATAAEQIVAGVARWTARDPLALFRRGSDDDLEWLVLASDPDPVPAWSVDRWRKLVARLEALGPRDTGAVDALVRRLPYATRATAEALVAGEAPTPELAAAVDLGRGLELAYLDKRRDLLPYLRIADPVGCCFSSHGPHYEGAMRTSGWVIRLHRDPLSYGFHVRRRDDGARVGFVFGGFGMVPEPTVLLNGVYLRRQDPAIRAAVLDAIERALARPLGFGLIGVAACHGGTGELPADYRFASRRGVRLRALLRPDSMPERVVYDDISRAVNEQTLLALHYKSLGGPPAAASGAS